MTHSYLYCGYRIEVRCEYALDRPEDGVQTAWQEPGYVAIVQVHAGDTSSIFLSPVRLADDSGRLFADSLDALSAGRVAGEIIVDDLLLDVVPGEPRARC